MASVLATGVLAAGVLAVGAAAVAFVCIFCAVFANWVAPHHPFDLATLEQAVEQTKSKVTKETSALQSLGAL